MNDSSRHDLLVKLLVLSLHYPEMRFGQLLCFACSIAGEKEPGFVDETSDHAVIEAVEAHLRARFGSQGREMGNGLSAWTEVRWQLLNTIKDLGNRFPEWATGELFHRIACLAHLNLYDAEDAELLTAARSENPGIDWYNQYSKSLLQISTVKERRDTPSYRCPCCRYLTLYERGGFEICPICYWEDDGQDDKDAGSVRGGPNGSLSLTQARENYARQGVCDLKYVDHVRQPRPNEL